MKKTKMKSVSYLPNGKAYKFQTWYTDEARFNDKRHYLQG